MLTFILLFAGQSTRMGQDKAILPFGKQSLLEFQLTKILSVPSFQQIIVVLNEAIWAKLPQLLANIPPDSGGGLLDKRLEWVINPTRDPNLSSSLKLALNASRATISDFWMPGDLPLISTQLLAQMADYMLNQPTISALIPTYRGRKGHPVAWNVRYRSLLTSLGESESPRDRMQSLAIHDPPQIFSWNSDEIYLDMDYPEDYQKYLARLGLS